MIKLVMRKGDMRA